ncbi:uncharacterized protein VTP21DRAFT_1 [Calcarisporiella thermophila]|uniref:uncharacterized protein n=1 Tax=Calcarisporiella thermophila TaxID=911321 RepID=UPI00374239C9
MHFYSRSLGLLISTATFPNAFLPVMGSAKSGHQPADATSELNLISEGQAKEIACELKATIGSKDRTGKFSVIAVTKEMPVAVCIPDPE